MGFQRDIEELLVQLHRDGFGDIADISTDTDTFAIGTTEDNRLCAVLTLHGAIPHHAAARSDEVREMLHSIILSRETMLLRL